MSVRPGLRVLQTFRTGTTAFKQRIACRTQTTAASPPTQSTFQRLWNSPVGVKTVHFWAPVMKWGLVLAGISDFFRPAENLSLSQNLALMTTGTIWTRWCFVIKPKNYFLAAVNFFLACVGGVQVSRILSYQRSVDKSTTTEELKKAKDDVVETTKGIAQDPKGAARNAVK